MKCQPLNDLWQTLTRHCWRCKHALQLYSANGHPKKQRKGIDSPPFMLVRMWQNIKMAIFHVEIYFYKSSLSYSWQVSLYTCQNKLASYQMFFFHVNLRAQFLYIKKDWWWARAWLRGSLGTDRRGNNMAAELGRVFRKYLVYFQSMHHMPGCARWWRPSWVQLSYYRDDSEQYVETLRVGMFRDETLVSD